MRHSRPRVSVLLPCRDASRFLPECVESLERQTLRELEILAVDDGSTDGTAKLLQRWAARDPRVRVLGPAAGDGAAAPASVPGLVGALDRASAAARAPLLARMDADDICDARRLELQAVLLDRDPALAACGCAVEMFPPAAVGTGYARYASWLNGLRRPEELQRDLFIECPVAHPTLMIRASVLRALGGYRDAGWPEDYDLLLRLHAAGMRAANLAETLLRWRVRPDRLSLASERYAADAFRRCKVHFLREAFLPASLFRPARRPLVVWGAGRVGKPLARELLRQRIAVDAFVDLDPRKIGERIHGAPVLDPRAFGRLAAERAPYVLAAVGSPGAREEIRASLRSAGFREIHDYRVCA